MLSKLQIPPSCGVGYVRRYLSIGVGAQSTLGDGRHFCPKTIYEKLTVSEFYVIYTRKINKSSRILHGIRPENAWILHDNCPKNIFPIFLGGGGGGTCPLPSPSPTPMYVSDMWKCPGVWSVTVSCHVRCRRRGGRCSNGECLMVDRVGDGRTASALTPCRPSSETISSLRIACTHAALYVRQLSPAAVVSRHTYTFPSQHRHQLMFLMLSREELKPVRGRVPWSKIPHKHVVIKNTLYCLPNRISVIFSKYLQRYLNKSGPVLIIFRTQNPRIANESPVFGYKIGLWDMIKQSTSLVCFNRNH